MSIGVTFTTLTPLTKALRTRYPTTGTLPKPHLYYVGHCHWVTIHLICHYSLYVPPIPPTPGYIHQPMKLIHFPEQVIRFQSLFIYPIYLSVNPIFL